MKRILIASVIAMSITSTAYANKGDTISEVQQVVDFKGLNKDVIYNGSRQWVATKFNSAQSVIQMDDKQSGVIIGKGNINYPCQDSWRCIAYQKSTIRFTVKIEAKDDKARITFSDLIQHQPANASTFSPEYNLPIRNPNDKLDTVSQVKAEFNKIIEDYKTTVSKTSPQKDNW